MNFLQRLGAKWEINSPRRIIIILIVFSLTGFTIVYAKTWIFALLGFDEQTSGWVKLFAWLLAVFPLYQVFLMIYGTLFGEFKFFWAKEKKLLQFVARPFQKKGSVI